MESFKPYVWLKKYKISGIWYYDALFTCDISAGNRILGISGPVDDAAANTRTYSLNLTPDGAATSTPGYLGASGSHTKPAGITKIVIVVTDTSGAGTVRGKKSSMYSDAEDVTSGGGRP